MSYNRPVHEEPRQAVTLAHVGWTAAKEFLIQLNQRLDGVYIAVPEVPRVFSEAESELSVFMNPNNISHQLPSSVPESKQQFFPEMSLSEKKCSSWYHEKILSKKELVTTLLEFIKRLREASRLLEQIDLLGPFIAQLIQLHCLLGDEIFPLTDSIVEALIDVVVGQLYATKLRKHFVTALDEIRKSASINTPRFFDIAYRRVGTCIASLKSMNENQNHCDPETSTDRTAPLTPSERRRRLTPDIQPIREIAVILEERQLFSPILWSRCHQSDPLVIQIFSSLSVFLLQEATSRYHSPSSVPCPEQTNSSFWLFDHDLSAVVRTASTVLFELFPKFPLPPSLAPPIHSFSEFRPPQSSISSLFSACVILLTDSSVPREVITICGLIVATIFSHTFTNRLDDLLAFRSLLEGRKCPIELGSVSQAYLDQLREKWTSEYQLIPRLSILRGLLVVLRAKDMIGEVDGSTELLLFLLQYVHGYATTENLQERLYITQSLLVWLSMTPSWISCRLLSNEQFTRAIPLILEVSLSNWDVSFPALRTLSVTLWTDLMKQSSALLSEVDPVKVSELYESLYVRILSLNSSCRKLQYLGLETFMSQLGINWVLGRQPFLIDHLLTSLCSRPTRNAALQFLMSLIRKSVSGVSKSECFPVSEVEVLTEKISRALLNVTDTLNPEIVQGFSEKVPLLLPDTDLDSSQLMFELSKVLVPALVKFPSLLMGVFEYVMREQVSKNQPWTCAEASLLLAACMNGYTRWTLKDGGEDEPIWHLEVVGDRPQSSLISISRARVTAGLIHCNPLIRLPLVEAVCTSRLTSAIPTAIDWELVRSICQCSLKNPSPEERCKTTVSVKKFLNRVMESLRQRSGMKHDEVSSLYLRVEETRQNLILLFQDLQRHIDPATPFDRLSTALDILTSFYQLASTTELAPLVDRTQFFEFLYTNDNWNAWISCALSNWDKQRSAAVLILETFVSPVSPELFLQKALECLLGIRQQDYLGGSCIISILAFISAIKPLLLQQQSSLLLLEQSFIQGQQFCKMIADNLQVTFKFEYEQQLSAIEDHLRKFKFDDILVLSMKLVFMKFILPIDLVHTILTAIETDLESLLMSDPSKRSVKIHGLLNLLHLILERLPIAAKLLELFSEQLKCLLPAALLKLHADVLSTILFHYSWQLSRMCVKIAAIHWKSTSYVLGVLMDGVDSVLMNFSVAVPADPSGSSILPKQIISIAQQSENLQRIHYVSGVDCRGHPFYNSAGIPGQGTDMEEDVDLLESWITIKSGAECLQRMFEWIDIDLLVDSQNHPHLETESKQSSSVMINVEFFNQLQHQLLILLLGIKHPAAMDKLFNATLSLNRKLLLSRRESYRKLPSVWLEKLFNLVWESSSYQKKEVCQKEGEEMVVTQLRLPPPLRRSYSLGLAFLSIVTADSTRYASLGLLPKAIERLLELAENDVERSMTGIIDEDESFSRVVHALNVVRCIVRSTVLVRPCAQYLGRILTVAVRYLSHQRWAVRNAANLLFASALDRATGGHWDLSGDESGVRSLEVDSSSFDSSRVSFCTHAPERELQSYGARQLGDILRLHPPLFNLISECLTVGTSVDPVMEGVTVALLLFLSRVKLTGPDQEDLQDEMGQLLDKISSCLYRSPSYHARFLAARSIVTTMIYRKAQTASTQMSHVLTTILSDGVRECFRGSTSGKTTLSNNALHGTLLALLELVSRPASCGTLVSEYLTSASAAPSETALGRCLNKMKEIFSCFHAAPLCKSVFLQMIERLLIGLSRSTVPLSQVQADRRQWLCEWARSFALSTLPSIILRRFPQEVYQNDCVATYRHISWDQLPCHSAMEISAIRLFLLSDFRVIFLWMRFMLKPQPVDANCNTYSSSLFLVMSEAFRICKKLVELLRKDPEQLPLYPYSNTATFLSELQSDIASSIDAVENFLRLIKEYFVVCKTSQSFSSPMSKSLLSIIGETTSNSVTSDLGLRGAKLLVALLYLQPSRRSSVLPTIYQTVSSIRAVLPSSPCVLKSVVLFGARIQKFFPDNPINEEWLDALKNATSPISDVNVRFSGLQALQTCGLVLDKLELWKRGIILVMDERPEIQEGASNVICEAFRELERGGEKQFRCSKTQNRFINEIRGCSVWLPSTSLYWATRYVVEKFPPRDVGNWLLSIITGRSTDFNIAPDLAGIRSEFSTDCHASIEVPKDRGMFDHEPSNIFNEDGYFVQLLGSLLLKLHHGTQLDMFLGNKEIMELSKQLEIFSNLCGIARAVPIGHITRTPVLAGTTQALIVRTAVTIYGLLSGKNEIPHRLKLNLHQLMAAAEGSGMYPPLFTAIKALNELESYDTNLGNFSDLSCSTRFNSIFFHSYVT